MDYVSDHTAYSQWSADNTLDPTKTPIGSHKIALWNCENSHTFESAVRNRINGTQCPYCSGKKKIAGINDLKTLYPNIYSELSSNNTADLTEIAPQSNKQLLWICSRGHEYLMAPNQRICSGSGCPFCANRRILVGFNDLASTHKELLNDWDFKKNSRKPNEVFTGSREKYWWLCDLGHSYAMSGGKRAIGQGCPYCNKGTLLVGFNDLLTKFPEVAKEWDMEKNEISPNQIIAGSGFKACWICNSGHSWQASLSNRTHKGSGCPDCSKRVSRGELEVRKFAESVIGKSSISSSREIISPYELDIYFPDESLAIEFNGTYWHSDSKIRANHDISAKQYHQKKIDLCNQKSIDLVFVWQKDWENDSQNIKTALQEFITSRKVPDVLRKLEGEVLT